MNEPQAVCSDGKGAVRAVVGKVRGKGRQCFVVTYLVDGLTNPTIGRGESITFSLADWKGDVEPRKEQVLELFGIQLFVKGWRATFAQPITLEPQATRKEDYHGK